jgi:transcriptional regulator with PAS, ATPase and Fis domain
MRKAALRVGFVGSSSRLSELLAGFSSAIAPSVFPSWDDLESVVAESHPEVIVTLPGCRSGGRLWGVPHLAWSDLDLAAASGPLELKLLEARLVPPGPEALLLGHSPVMARLRGALVTLARDKHPLLLTGENGTGKDLAATVAHRLSVGAEAPFVAVNCGAVPAALAESEFFGCVRGAFTGAENRLGFCQQARGGTLFLDEVGELVPEIQAKLLRVLENHEVRRVGGSHTETTDFRLIGATNRDLAAEVKAGRFREDLFYRIHVLPLHIPALRDRKEDLEVLALHFLENEFPGRPGPFRLTPRAVDKMGAYHWPGNLRELRNVVVRAAVLYGGVELDAGHLEW